MHVALSCKYTKKDDGVCFRRQGQPVAPDPVLDRRTVDFFRLKIKGDYYNYVILYYIYKIRATVRIPHRMACLPKTAFTDIENKTFTDSASVDEQSAHVRRQPGMSEGVQSRSAPAKYDYNTGKISSASASCVPRDRPQNNGWMKMVFASRPITAGSALSGRKPIQK